MSETTTELERQIAEAARQGVAASVKESLTGFNRPLSNLTDKVVERKRAELDALMDAGLDAVISDPSFKEAIEEAIRSKLARCLVGALGGEIEKRINALKANPVTRARLTLALEVMIDEGLAGQEQETA